MPPKKKDLKLLGQFKKKNERFFFLGKRVARNVFARGEGNPHKTTIQITFFRVFTIVFIRYANKNYAGLRGNGM